MEYSTGLCLFLSVFLPLVHHSVQQGLCYDTMEIVIVVDGSYSIEEDTFYGPVKNVLRSFSSRVFNLGTSHRMGLVLFSHELDYTVNLTGNITEFQTEVSNLKHPMGGTGTFLAIKAAATMLKQYGRRNVPKIMLVITDGESSDTGRTKQEAMTAKADSIIIYAAWVGDLITQEIRDMASSSQHIINAVDYTQLEKKLADLVKCIVDGGWTDWQLLSYGTCSVTCGVGTRTKNEIRYCTNPAPSNGGKNCLNNDRRSITVDCDTNVPCKITGLCQNAKLIKGVGYRLHPTDCDKFIQCYYRSTGYTLAVIRTCSYGQFWDQNQARCRPSCFVDCPLERCKDDCVSTYNMDGSCRAYWSCNNGKSEAKCCPMGFAYVNKRGCLLDFSCREECPVICSNPEVCDLRPVWTNTHNFEELKETAVWIEASCLRSSLYFDIIGCHCSASSTRDCLPRMTMDFSNPNRLNSDVGISVSSSNLHVTGGIGVFNGNSQITTDLKVPQPGYPISIRFMYRETSPVSTRQVLVSAPWCRMAETVAMVIYIESGVIGIEVKNWYGTQMKMTIPTNGFSDKEWKDVLFAYDGKFITGTVQSGNNKHVNRAYAPNQQMVECGINFGTDGTSKFFSGWMDNIRVYQCDPSIPKYN